jgi:hypothetical protein
MQIFFIVISEPIFTAAKSQHELYQSRADYLSPIIILIKPLAQVNLKWVFCLKSGVEGQNVQ